MRVLHVSAGNLYGGVETMLVTLARERQSCLELEPEFAVCFEGRFVRELRQTGVAVHSIGAVRTSRPWTIWRARRRLYKLVQSGRYDAVICHMAWAIAIFGPAATKAGSKLVFWLHDVAQGKHWLERWASLTRPDLAICNSRFTLSTLSNLYPATHSEVVYCPVSRRSHAFTDADRAALRAQLGVSPDEIVIIQVSRMEAWKGHELHLDALQRLRSAPGWQCWIVGGPQRAKEHPYFAKLQSIAAASGIGDRVRFLGQRSDVADLLAAADVFCQPNLGPEPFGIVFIEALLAGLPVLATAMGGALEIVDETCGLLAPPNDAQGLALGLKRLIDDPVLRLRLGSAGPRRADAISGPGVVLNGLHTRLKRLLADDISRTEPAAEMVAK